MAFRSIFLLKTLRNACVIRYNCMSTTALIPKVRKINKPKEYVTEENLVYLEDPDTFGTLSGRSLTRSKTLEDEGDTKEEEFIGNKPLSSQKLTIKQYSDIIKQHLKHKRLKEAIDVLEVRMLKEDRVKPSNYIYNILIGACADVGYTKKAFKLFNDMKRRALKTTGDTYTCLFEACSNSPWALDGLKNAKHLRNLMMEKGIEPNITNFNAMIKAFGRCGDLHTAFKIVDEMISKKIKIRVHTFNHLLQACISDKETGLRHALVVWRKMLRLREKPNIYSFNLMLKCVKECNLGSKEDIEDLIQIIQQETPMAIETSKQEEILQIESAKNTLDEPRNIRTETEFYQERTISSKALVQSTTDSKSLSKDFNIQTVKEIGIDSTDKSSIAESSANETVTLQFVEKGPALKKDDRMVPNFLSKIIKLHQVLSLQEVEKLQDKFAIIGGQEDFLKELDTYSVKPDIKTFTQMLSLLDDSLEAENKLLASMKALKVKADIDFYNMLIKKRCLRCDYDNAVAVKDMITKEDIIRKKKYQYNKKLRLKPNVMTYGVLALACKTQDSAEKLLSEMKENQLRINIQVLGTLLRHGTANNQFGYIVYIMKTVKEENVQVNDIFLKHLEDFNAKCVNFIEQTDENGKPKSSQTFEKAFNRFTNYYSKWLNEIDVKEALEPAHPWQQFKEDHPETVQRFNYEIVEPKKFYKRDRRYMKYRLRM